MVKRTMRWGLAAALVVLGLQGATAAPLAPAAEPAASPAVVEVQSCGYVRNLCRNRWGGGPNFRRCVRARGCPAARPANYCQRVRRSCVARFPAGSRPYFRCMARNNC